MSRGVIAVVTLFAFALATVPRGAAAQPSGDPDAMQQAKVHFEAGRSAYQANDFAGAIREFKAAQTLRPSPVLDFNIGLAYEGLGKPRAAVKYYRRYLEGKPDAQNRPEVEAKMGALEQQIVAERQPPAANEDPGAPPPPVEGQPQYQYGSDPYAGEPMQPPPQKAKKKSSYWWIIFPILGGATLLTLLIFFYVSTLSVTYGAVSTPPAGAAHPDQTGVLFRF